jgi:uncharacterized protein YndB with AHSA1/START domain
MIISKSIFVKRPVDRAFHLFTTEIGKWWPLKEGLSLGADRAHEIFLEGHVGGRFFERFTDGAEFEVGVVTAYEPPRRVVFTWRQPDWNAATEVEVRFAPEADGTRVELEHRGWNALRAELRKTRGGYDGGWDLALSRYVAITE